MSVNKLKQAKALRQLQIDEILEILALAQLAVTDQSLHVRFNLRCSNLDDILEEFKTMHNSIISILSTIENPDMIAEKEIKTSFMDNFFTVKTIYTNLFNEETSSNIDTTSTTPNVKLPKISLPTFDGSYKNWPTFFDIFNSLIHTNSTLSDIDKFQYLLSSLSSETRNLLKGYQLTKENYQLAFETLTERYQNKRLLANSFWKEICNAPKLTNESVDGLRNLLAIFSENLTALKNLNLPIEDWDFILFHSLIQKLDIATIKRFELQECSTEIPSYRALYKFLKNQCISLESLKFSVSQRVNASSSDKPYKKSSTFLTQSNSPNKFSCSYCNANHSIYKCSSFLNEPPSARLQIVKDKNWCINCLHSGHRVSGCSSKSTCRHCHKSHHTLLHLGTIDPSPETIDPCNEIPSTSMVCRSQVLTNISASPATVLLATARVEVLDARGQYQNIRILLDPGSQTNIITQKCVKRLGLECFKTPLAIFGLGETSASVSDSITCTIRPIGSINPSYTIDAVVLPKICSNMPNNFLPYHEWYSLSNIKLADPTFHSPGPVDMLVGAAIFPLILRTGRLPGNLKQPSALQTVFGWILMGNTSSPSASISSFHLTANSVIDSTLRQFWEIEEIPKSEISSPDDALCEKIFDDNYSRDSTGRYTVMLPFKEGINKSFGDTYTMALRRLFSLERRFKTSPDFYNEYKMFMKDYLDCGHMTLLPNASPSVDEYYIPHHAVINRNSPSTKLRVVFDSSAKVSGNVSLNEILLTGPKLQKDVMALLLNFRFYKVVFTADIKQMYRQILVHPSHRRFQRILFRFSLSDPVRVYELNTVTYGVASSPYIALRTLKQLSSDEAMAFPSAVSVLRSETYVDDILSGGDSLEEARGLQDELISLLRRGGFELRKWSSNRTELIDHFPPDHRHQESLNFDDSVLKILGLRWFPAGDHFSYVIDSTERPVTKRTILSDLARIFDPIGFLTPFTFLAKHLIQHLWTLGLQWDDVPPSELTDRWNQCKSELQVLSTLRIPRRIFTQSFTKCEAHGFGDSSEKGYAAVVYFRFINPDGSINISLIGAKSRVSPIKRISLPKLELCAALLLSKLLSFIIKSYGPSLKVDEIFAWSDSTVVLHWIKSSPYRWKSFVSNRTSQIQELVPPDRWYYVKSQDNPADCASRGMSPSGLLDHSLWWAGPPWLQSKDPIGKPGDPKIEEMLTGEERQVVLSTFASSDVFDDLIMRYSSFFKLQQVVIYLFRFSFNLRSPHSKRIGSILSVERKQALNFLIKCVQQRVFGEEIQNLRLNRPITVKYLQKLNLFIGDDDILRVGGRLTFSGLQYDHKFPALLPNKHLFTDIFIQHFHRLYLHPGSQTLQFLLSQQVWILSARKAIRRVTSKCLVCFRSNPKPLQPLMGNLPSYRVNQLKPFQCVGVDFGGPFLVTMSKGRGIKSTKAYICLFVCFSTKALHLELVSDLTSEAFLAALKRFIARRGRCTRIFSDGGSNFKGAQRELISYMKCAVEAEKIDWDFNPPSAPHFGGLWEIGIKSVKSHLYKLIGDQILSYEEMYTVLVQIEAVLNSRPLCPLSTDPNDLSVLTPGHFLTLAPISDIPEPDLSNVSLNRLSRWQLITRLHQDFWKRWHVEYLNTLQQRTKWFTPRDSQLSVGQLVLIRDEQLPPRRWRMARVIDVHLGKDGIARVATVRTVSGILQRPVVKLCPLPGQA